MNASSFYIALADLLWPLRCVACSTRILESVSLEVSRVFCPTCAETLLFVSEPICSKCGLPFDGAGPSHSCSTCIADPPPFEKARTVLLYGGAAAEAIQRFKYSPAPHLSKQLSGLLEMAACTISPPDAIVPVPLHPKRLRTRGFNQSALLARPLSITLDAPFCPSILRRIRDTQNQAGLSRAERVINLKGAFSIQKAKRIAGRRVLLIDDVITTTATVREAAITLLQSGAASVEVIALARASSSASLAPLRQKS